MRLNRTIGRATGAAILSALGMMLTADGALTQPSQGQINAIRQSCRSDYIAHCSSVTPGGPEALHCLQQNEGNLSSSCRGAVQALKPAAAPASKPPAPAAPVTARPAGESPRAPKPAAATAKPSAKPATQAARTPPASRKPVAAPAAPPPAAASWPPYEPMPPLPIRTRLAIVRACDADRQAACSMVPIGHDGVIDCLVRNAPSLSATCQRTLAWARNSVRRY